MNQERLAAKPLEIRSSEELGVSLSARSPQTGAEWQATQSLLPSVSRKYAP
jgi:hypothetical protein